MVSREKKTFYNTITNEIRKFEKRSKFITIRRINNWSYGCFRIDLTIIENKLNTKVPAELLNYLKSFCDYCEDERETNQPHPAIWLKNYDDHAGCIGYVDENNIIHFYENEEDENLIKIEFCIALV